MVEGGWFFVTCSKEVTVEWAMKQTTPDLKDRRMNIIRVRYIQTFEAWNKIPSPKGITKHTVCFKVALKCHDI